MEGIKNFVTVLTLLDFSLVFLSSNLLNGAIVGCDWAFWCLFAYASSSSLCSLGGKRNYSCDSCQMDARAPEKAKEMRRWDYKRHNIWCLRITGERTHDRRTSQQVPSHPESVFAFLADFPLASTLSTGPAKQCCHKNHILFCKAALIGPDGSHAAGSSSFTKVSAPWRGGEQKTEKLLKLKAVSTTSNAGTTTVNFHL